MFPKRQTTTPGYTEATEATEATGAPVAVEVEANEAVAVRDGVFDADGMKNVGEEVRFSSQEMLQAALDNGLIALKKSIK